MAMRWLNKQKQKQQQRKLGNNQSPDTQVPLLPHKTFPSGIKLLHDVEGSLVDIVFIHGLTGDREKTWIAKSVNAPWPQVLLPARVPNGRFLTFGYDAYVTDWRGMVSKNRIGNHSWSLLTTLATYREDDDTNDRPIIFVCHSLGGLVCEDALSTARQRPEKHLQKILHCTRGIIFLGTPHHGSGLALWAERLAQVIGLLKQTNPDILSILQADSEVLARVQDSFHTMIRSRIQDGRQPIEITCFFEELPLPGVGLVVPSHSAVLPGYIPIPLRSNHMDMTKFDSIEDPGFIAISGELRRWVKELRVNRNVEMSTETLPRQQQLAQATKNLSLSELSGTQCSPPTQPIQNHQTLEYQELQAQNTAKVSYGSSKFSSPAQVTIKGQENQTDTPQSSVSSESAPSTVNMPSAQVPVNAHEKQKEISQIDGSLGGIPPANSIPSAPPTRGAAPSGINIVGTAGNINIGNSEQHLSGNFYGGVHLLQASNQSHPFAAYLPQANMGPNERQLLKAAGNGDIDKTLKLIQEGANIDAINEEGHSAVTIAISKQHMNVVKLLVESGGTMDRTGFLVHKPLHMAVLSGNVDLVKYILDNGADIDETTARGSVLFLAVSFQQESIVTLLLSRNANPDIGASGIVPLYKAISSRKESFIYLLMKYGARACNVPAVYMRKLSPACQNLVRHWASHAEYSVYAKTMRRESSDRNQQETALSSALSYAVDNDHKEVHSIFMELATEFAIPVDEGHGKNTA